LIIKDHKNSNKLSKAPLYIEKFRFDRKYLLENIFLTLKEISYKSIDDIHLMFFDFLMQPIIEGNDQPFNSVLSSFAFLYDGILKKYPKEDPKNYAKNLAYFEILKNYLNSFHSELLSRGYDFVPLHENDLELMDVKKKTHDDIHIDVLLCFKQIGFSSYFQIHGEVSADADLSIKSLEAYQGISAVGLRTKEGVGALLAMLWKAYGDKNTFKVKDMYESIKRLTGYGTPHKMFQPTLEYKNIYKTISRKSKKTINTFFNHKYQGIKTPPKPLNSYSAGQLAFLFTKLEGLDLLNKGVNENDEKDKIDSFAFLFGMLPSELKEALDKDNISEQELSELKQHFEWFRNHLSLS